MIEPDAEIPANPQKASVGQVAKAVFWSFLGIRRGQQHDRDAVTIKPLQIVIAGVIGAVLFVVVLVTIVRVITR